MTELLEATPEVDAATVEEAGKRFEEVYHESDVDSDVDAAVEFALVDTGVPREDRIAIIDELTRDQRTDGAGQFPTLREEYESELVDDALEDRERYLEDGNTVVVDLDSETSVQVLSHSELSGYVDPIELYADVTDEVGHIDSFDSESDAEELAAAARCALSFKVKAYSRDIAHQIVAEDVDGDELAEFVQRFANQFPIWHLLNFSAIHREIGEVHEALAQLRGQEHLSSDVIRNILADHGY